MTLINNQDVMKKCLNISCNNIAVQYGYCSTLCMEHDDLGMEPEPNDPVSHPAHYTDGKIEVIDFIEDKRLGFHLGNAVKYISRAGKKDPNKKIEDLNKAIWYVQRHIIVLETK